MGRAVSNIVEGVGDAVGDLVESDLGKAALLGGAAYFGAPYLLGSSAAGAGLSAAASDALLAGAAGTSTPVSTSLLGGGSGLLGGAIDWAKANPLTAGAGALALAGGLGGSQPSSTTTTQSIDPQLKAAYLRNLEEARATAAGLAPRQFAGVSPLYTAGEAQLAAASQRPFTSQEIAAFQNPYEEQVVQQALKDIERQRLMGRQAEAQRAIGARAFGGSRQGVAQSLVDEAALEQAARTSAGLRQQGFGTAAELAQRGRLLERQGALDLLGLGGTRRQMTQEQLDAARTFPLERLQIAQGALTGNLPNLGMTSTSPIYRNQGAGALGGALAGAQLGRLVPSIGTGLGAGLGGLLGLFG